MPTTNNKDTYDLSYDALPSWACSALSTNPFYDKMVREGYEAMAGLNVVIAGLARNIGEDLNNTIARIERTGDFFNDYAVCIFENDSTDGTTERLAEWQARNPNVVVKSEKFDRKQWGPVRDLGRMVDLAEYRNACRNMILESYPEADYVILVDTDLKGGWKYDGIANSFSQVSRWDFCGSVSWAQVNNKWVHYDVWACRPNHWKALHARDINPWLPLPGQDLIPVKSCFGGLGIYRMDAYKSAEYAGYDCEHVCFHQRMIEKGYGRIYMNPSQITLY